MTRAVVQRRVLTVVLTVALVRATVAETVTIHEPESIAFRADPRIPGVAVAIVAGDPTHGPYTIRVKFEPNVRVPPHRHSDERTVTVMSGTYRFAVGDRFDAARLHSYPSGTVIVVPAGIAHFVAAGDEPVLLQESGIGPTGTEVVARP